MTFLTEEDFRTVEEQKEITIWPPEYSPVVQLIPYLKRLKPLHGVEIGTGRGENVYMILEAIPSMEEFVTVDPYVEYENWNGVVKQEDQDRFKDIAKKNIGTFHNANYIYETAEKAAERFDEKYFDFIIWDGQPKTKQVVIDLEAFYSKLRDGGIMFGSNLQLPEVFDGVKEFRAKNRARQPINRLDNFGWFVYK